MSLTILPDPVPIWADDQGILRVGKSQVLLDVVIGEFHNAADPKDIARAFSTLELADVYGAIAYYLRHRSEVDEYLRSRREEAARLQERIEVNTPGLAELRAKLLARKTDMARTELEHASPGM